MIEPPQCGKCGYDLSGLRPAGTCPECGNPYDLGRRRGLRQALSREERGNRLLRLIVNGILAALGAATIIVAAVIANANREPNALIVGAFFGVMMIGWAAVNILAARR